MRITALLVMLAVAAWFAYTEPKLSDAEAEYVALHQQFLGDAFDRDRAVRKARYMNDEELEAAIDWMRQLIYLYRHDTGEAETGEQIANRARATITTEPQP